MATDVSSFLVHRYGIILMLSRRAASKDPELESTYLKLLKESSPHEKAITRDLGR